MAKGRPRFSRRGDFVRVYTPRTTREWEKDVASQVSVHLMNFRMDGRLSGVDLPLAGRVACSMRFNFDKPKSYPKKVKDHVKKPDPDNLSKSILDAFSEAGLIKDDNIVTDLFIKKRYSDAEHPEGVEVELVAWLTT